MGPFIRNQSHHQEPSTPPISGNRQGRRFVEHGPHIPFSTRPGVCQPRARQQGTAACGQADSFAGSHWLLRPKSRQKLALWGSCRPANPWHSGDTARKMLAKSAWEVTSSHCFPRRGLDQRKPLLSDVMVFVHQPRKSEREKATYLTSCNGEKGFSKVVDLGMRPNVPKSQLSLLFFHLLMVFKNWKNYDPADIGPLYHCFLKKGVVQRVCWTNTEKSAHHLTMVNTQSTCVWVYTNWKS